MNTKACRKCGRELPASEYYRHSGDKLRSECKECTRAARSAYCAAHPDQGAAYMKEYNQKPEVKGKASIRRADPEYQERARKWAQRWRESNRERDRRNAICWAVNNPERARARNRRRKARKAGAATHPFTEIQLADKVAYWGNRCWVCGGEWDAIDHVKPLARGGAHMLCNLRPICTPCNSAKCSKWPFAGRAEIRRLSGPTEQITA